MAPFPERALFLAPMVGITNRAFRSLVAELGAPDWSFTEMAGVEGFLEGRPDDAAYIDPGPDPQHCSIQFFAKRPERLALACAKVRDTMGERLPAGIDINFGCSAPGIRRAGGGTAWSGDPDGALRLVEAARAAWPGLLSAKLRSGPDEDPERLLSHCRRLEGAGLDFLCIHPRTDSQKFKGAANHSLTGILAENLGIPVVANGDVRSPGQAAALFAARKPAALMIGREAARRPWVFALLRGTAPAAIDRLALGLRYLDLAETMVPGAWRLENASRFFSYYSEGFSFSHHMKWPLVNAPDLPTLRARFAAYFDEVPEDRMLSLEA